AQVRLLNVDPGADTNRTVVTFVGEPGAVVEAAFLAIQKAAEVIDMSRHSGTHPRMGATDVCPFIPISGVTDEECVELAQKLGRSVGTKLGIPIYLYGKAASRPERQNLPDIRQGEYEALPQKMADPTFKPDFGPSVFNAKSGATVIGVRDFMLAYNVNLNIRDRALAKEIALNLRESGRLKRDKQGRLVRDAEGKKVRVPGKLSRVQATGWYIDEYGYAQVTMNLHDLQQTSLHQAFESVVAEAAKLGLRVTGSELIGMTPKQSLIEAGNYYLQRQGKQIGVPEKQVIHTAILSLGLNDTMPFLPEERIIEYAIDPNSTGLVQLSLTDFADELSSNSPAPGGGSVSALSGALSAALSAMVASLTYGKKEYRRQNRLMQETAVAGQRLKARFIGLIDADSQSFNEFMAAMRLPKKTPAEKEIRVAAMQAASLRMTEVPLETLCLTKELLVLAESVIKRGNSNAISDAGVAAKQAEAAAFGAWLNVRVNLPQIADIKQRKQLSDEADEVLENVQQSSRRLLRLVKGKLPV
ncbi:glutamate formimidoyltransferase, partial [bacterium]|nr:glutamate formimidoyltransferase [bacterium]